LIRYPGFLQSFRQSGNGQSNGRRDQPGPPPQPLEDKRGEKPKILKPPEETKERRWAVESLPLAKTAPNKLKWKPLKKLPLKEPSLKKGEQREAWTRAPPRTKSDKPRRTEWVLAGPKRKQERQPRRRGIKLDSAVARRERLRLSPR